MNPLQEQHTHPKDPPEKVRSPELDKWPAEHSSMLKEMVESKEYSFREITAKINATFDVAYTRSSIIGRSMRMGLRNNRPDKNNIEHRPRLRIVRANGNTPNLKVSFSVECDLPALRSAEIEPRHLTLAELGPHDCRYPYGDGPFTFCGRFQRASSSYCNAHHILTWIPPTERNQSRRGFR